jgi:hypothetical protein
MVMKALPRFKTKLQSIRISRTLSTRKRRTPRFRVFEQSVPNIIVGASRRARQNNLLLFITILRYPIPVRPEP